MQWMNDPFYMFQKFRVNRFWLWFVMQFLLKSIFINSIDFIEPGVIWIIESIGLRELTNKWNKASNLKYRRRKRNEFSDWPIAAVAVCLLCFCRQNFVCWFSPLLLFCVAIKTIKMIRSLLNNDLRVWQKTIDALKNKKWSSGALILFVSESDIFRFWNFKFMQFIYLCINFLLSVPIFSK